MNESRAIGKKSGHPAALDGLQELRTPSLRRRRSGTDGVNLQDREWRDRRRLGSYAHDPQSVLAATELAGRRELEHGPRSNHGQRRLAGMSGKADLSRSRKLTTETIGEVLCRSGY